MINLQLNTLKINIKVKVLVSLFLIAFLIQLNYLIKDNSFVLGFFHESQNQPMLTYTDNKFNFMINYPDNWEKSVKINNEIIFIAPKDSDSVSSPAGLVVKVVPTPGKNVSAESASKALITELQTEHKDFLLESSGSYAVDGNKAVQVIFTATDSKLQNRKAMQIVFTNYENVYVITYKASVDKYGAYENTVNEMVKSFKFTPR